MPISLLCTCGKSFKVKDAAAGKNCRCPQCGAVMPVPLATPDTPAAMIAFAKTDDKPCPWCKAAVPADASLCKQCGYDFVKKPKAARCTMCGMKAPAGALLCGECAKKPQPKGARKPLWAAPTPGREVEPELTYAQGIRGLLFGPLALWSMLAVGAGLGYGVFLALEYFEVDFEALQIVQLGMAPASLVMAGSALFLAALLTTKWLGLAPIMMAGAAAASARPEFAPFIFLQRPPDSMFLAGVPARELILLGAILGCAMSLVFFVIPYHGRRWWQAATRVKEVYERGSRKGFAIGGILGMVLGAAAGYGIGMFIDEPFGRLRPPVALALIGMFAGSLPMGLLGKTVGDEIGGLGGALRGLIQWTSIAAALAGLAYGTLFVLEHNEMPLELPRGSGRLITWDDLHRPVGLAIAAAALGGLILGGIAGALGGHLEKPDPQPWFRKRTIAAFCILAGLVLLVAPAGYLGFLAIERIRSEHRILTAFQAHIEEVPRPADGAPPEATPGKRLEKMAIFTGKALSPVHFQLAPERRADTWEETENVVWLKWRENAGAPVADVTVLDRTTRKVLAHATFRGEPPTDLAFEIGQPERGPFPFLDVVRFLEASPSE